MTAASRGMPGIAALAVAALLLGACDGSPSPTSSESRGGGPAGLRSFDLGADLDLAGWGCGAHLFPRQRDLVPAPRHLDFTATVPGVVTFYHPRVGGTYAGLHAGIFAVGEGTTRVIARHQSGAADTVVVRVGAGTGEVVLHPSESFTGPTQRQSVGLSVGDTVRAGAYVATPCGGLLYGPHDHSWRDAAPEWPATQLLNRTPETLATLASGDGWMEVVPTRAGGGVIVRPDGEAADTFVTEVFDARLLPADTTVRVGETVRFRALLADSSGVLPITPAVLQVSADYEDGAVVDGAFTAPAPATVVIWARWDVPRHGDRLVVWKRSTVRIVE